LAASARMASLSDSFMGKAMVPNAATLRVKPRLTNGPAPCGSQFSGKALCGSRFSGDWVLASFRQHTKAPAAAGIADESAPTKEKKARSAWI
jgi:hypothetical protein